MATFPLRDIPTISWHKGSGYDAYFGAGRKDDPRMGIHAACDLAADPGTPILAIENGVIHKGPYWFVEYDNPAKGNRPACHSVTYAIEVVHDHFIGRYCEIAPKLPDGLKVKTKVDEGQVIAYVGAQCGMSMLHFEMFKNISDLSPLNDNKTGKYLFVPAADYRRREDLLDPTDDLDRWAAELRRMKWESHREIDDADYNPRYRSYP
jgi:murein DD-endopeptidase MepM/ murein hydrolase activator NlpD